MTTPRFRRSTLAGSAPAHPGTFLDPVACTKVRMPVLRDDAIARGRLLHAVRDALERYSVVLVSAPAGYGKTTLLASLPIACPEARVAWLTLEDDDNDPRRFRSALAAALSVVAPALADPRSYGAASAAFIDHAVNELVRTPHERVVLVLDELHLVEEPEVLRDVSRLAERAPSVCRIAIATRHRPALPIARWKARRIVGEIGLEELAFTPEEAKEYLNFAYGLDATDAAALELTERAEGWPAGVALLASALAPGVAASEVAASHHRDIDALIEQEVFSGLDPELRVFLLETCILPELTPSRCQEVTERADAPALLEELVRLNLVIPVTHRARSAFRYHEMFRRFLERRLVVELPEAVATLERRAAEARERAQRESRSVRVPETGETLSLREIEVLELVASGASNAEIAAILFISIHTVKRHVATILHKLSVDSRVRAAAAARRLGIVP